ncbi:MAG: ELM1/GtrOC1 family putative glycosyltransferase [Pseudomonadota bacterium]
MSVRSEALARPLPLKPERPVEAALPRASLLFGTTRGDNAQMLNLAQALGWPFEVKGEVDGVPMTVVDRVAHAFGYRLRRNKPLLSSLLWPDLILCCGGRRVIDALRIKDLSEGRSKIVCIGRPWADLDLFDLVITTPQYRLPTRQNVLMNAMPLNQPSAEALAIAANEWHGDIKHLPTPWIAVLVGGNSGSCIFDANAAQRLAAEANAVAAQTGGSLLISTSGRTPKPAVDTLLSQINGPHFAFRWEKTAQRNPHLGFLALANRFIVTSDSASMIAEAISTGREVSIFEVPLRRRSRWLTKKRKFGHTTHQMHRWLTEKGLWIPARDMNAYRDNLIDGSYVLDGEQANDSFSPRRPRDLDRAIEAIYGLFPSLSPPRGSDDIVKVRRSHAHGFAIAG